MEETREGGIWVLAICGKSSGTKGLKYQSAPRGAIHASKVRKLETQRKYQHEVGRSLSGTYSSPGSVREGQSNGSGRSDGHNGAIVLGKDKFFDGVQGPALYC